MEFNIFITEFVSKQCLVIHIGMIKFFDCG